VFEIQRSYHDEIIAHAREDAPNECCGILAGNGDRIVHLYRTTNSEHSPYRYNVDGKQLKGILDDLDAKGWDMLGIYHSHTATEAYPSPTDVRLAMWWPDALYFIVSLQDAERPLLRAFHIVDGAVTEEPLRVANSTGSPQVEA